MIKVTSAIFFYLIVLSNFSQSKHSYGIGAQFGTSRWNYNNINSQGLDGDNQFASNFGFELQYSFSSDSRFGMGNTLRYKTLSTYYIVENDFDNTLYYDFRYTNYTIEYSPAINYTLKKSEFSIGLNFAYFLFLKTLNNFNSIETHQSYPMPYSYFFFSNKLFTGIDLSYAFTIFQNKFFKVNLLATYSQYFRPNISSFMIGLRILRTCGVN